MPSLPPRSARSSSRRPRLCGTCVASLQIESVDGIAPIFAPADTGVSVQETVNFGDTPLNTVAEKVVRLLNTTPLPLRFEWRHLALPLENLPPTALRTGARLAGRTG